MDWPNGVYLAPPILTPFHNDSLAAYSSLLTNAISTAWTVNNKGYYYPFRLDEFHIAYQLLFYVGSASAGNIDVGIYDSQKNRIVSSGSTAMGTASTIQQLNIADTTLPPGDYLLGVACSTTGGTCFAHSGADELLLASAPVYEQTSALALPNPCTPVICTDASVPRWAIGIQFVPTF